MKTILITGVAGFIGSHTAELALKQGYKVIGVDNLSTGKEENIEHLDVILYVDSIYNNLEYIFEKNEIDYIIHLGAKLSVPESMVYPGYYQRNNVEATYKLLDLAYRHRIKKMVLASTCAVEGDSYYGLSKKITEEMANWFTKNYKLPTACLRYVNVYGKRQAEVGEGAVVPAFINTLKNGITPVVHGDGLQTRDYVYVKDVAEANLHAMKTDFTGITYVSTGTETSVIDLLNKIGVALDKTPKPIFKARREGDMMFVGQHLPKLEFGWNASYGLDRGLEDMLK